MTTLQKTDTLNEIADILHIGEFSCVLKNNSGDIKTFSQRGISDLYNLLQNNPKTLKDAFVADKIIGKAAAALLVVGEIKGIYANIISAPAYDLFIKAGIYVIYVKKVNAILNRDKTDLCPMEKRCITENSIPEILKIIDGFISKK